MSNPTIEFDSPRHSRDIFAPVTQNLNVEPSNFVPHNTEQQQTKHIARPRINDARIPSFSTTADTWPAYQCHFLAGGISLATAYALVHPLDTIKTNMQATISNTSTFSAIRSAVLSTSVLRSFMHGFTVSIVGAAPQGAIRFSTYELVKCKMLKSQAEKARRTGDLGEFHHPFLTTATSAACGDLASSIVKIPREVITQRLQTKQYANGMDAFRGVLATEGWRGLYRGYVSTACRDIPFMIILFSAYENIKSMSGGVCHEYWAASCAAGAASGGLAGFATTPVDTIKTRIMTAGPGARVSMYQAGRTLVQQHGARSLMTGSFPRSLWWFCVCGVFFPAYERSKAALYSVYNHRQHDYNHEQFTRAMV